MSATLRSFRVSLPARLFVYVRAKDEEGAKRAIVDAYDPDGYDVCGFDEGDEARVYPTGADGGDVRPAEVEIEDEETVSTCGRCGEEYRGHECDSCGAQDRSDQDRHEPMV